MTESIATPLFRRKVLAAAGMSLMIPLVALPQQTLRVARIGYLVASSPADNAAFVHQFRDSMRELGYIEGKNLTLEFRFANGRFDRLPELANELVQSKVEVIIAVGDPVILAAKQATSTIPIVMPSVGDPVARGFITSLARPGGNVTGVSNFAVGLTAKWLESLKQIIPNMKQVAVMHNDANPTHPLFLEEAKRAAPALGLKLQLLPLHSPDDLESAFASISREQSDALVVLPDPLLAGLLRTRIPNLALANRVPLMCTFREQAESGCLISYGPNLIDNYRQAAVYVDKILKGAKPGELPVAQPTKFDMVVNLRTANKLGLTLPPSVTMRADEVIQ